MLEATSEPAPEPSKTSSTTSEETSPIIGPPEELNVGDIGTQTPKPNLDETTSSFKQDAKTPPPEYLHPVEEGISHPLHPYLEALLFGKETEILDPTSLPPHRNSDSEVQALTSIDENGKVVKVIAESEESDWWTSSVGKGHREICPVCLGVVKRDKDEVMREGGGDVGNEGENGADLRMRGGHMGERRVCMGCNGQKVRIL
jgi:hypothetical protein